MSIKTKIEINQEELIKASLEEVSTVSNQTLETMLNIMTKYNEDLKKINMEKEKIIKLMDDEVEKLNIDFKKYENENMNNIDNIDILNLQNEKDVLEYFKKTDIITNKIIKNIKNMKNKTMEDIKKIKETYVLKIDNLEQSKLDLYKENYINKNNTRKQLETVITNNEVLREESKLIFTSQGYIKKIVNNIDSIINKLQNITIDNIILKINNIKTISKDILEMSSTIEQQNVLRMISSELILCFIELNNFLNDTNKTKDTFYINMENEIKSFIILIKDSIEIINKTNNIILEINMNNDISIIINNNNNIKPFIIVLFIILISFFLLKMNSK
jgi:hypothetical protein